MNPNSKRQRTKTLLAYNESDDPILGRNMSSRTLRQLFCSCCTRQISQTFYKLRSQPYWARNWLGDHQEEVDLKADVVLIAGMALHFIPTAGLLSACTKNVLQLYTLSCGWEGYLWLVTDSFFDHVGIFLSSWWTLALITSHPRYSPVCLTNNSHFLILGWCRSDPWQCHRTPVPEELLPQHSQLCGDRWTVGPVDIRAFFQP